MNKNTDILNEYMANLKVEVNNLYNLHFNVVGSMFREIHLLLEKYYKQFGQMYDQVAERIKMLKGYPLTNLVKIEEISQIKSMQSRDYTEEQVLDVLNNDFAYLRDYTKDLIGYFSNEGDVYTSHMLLEFLMFLEKELWMNEATSKKG